MSAKSSVAGGSDPTKATGPSEEEINKLVEKFGVAQRELTEQIQFREVLEMQEQENKIVAEEFKNLEDDAKVYKLTGPVLLPQPVSEAKSNVDKRLEFIRNEIKRVEKNISSKQAAVSLLNIYSIIIIMITVG